MKKLISMILAFLMLLSLACFCACSEKEIETPTATPQAPTTTKAPAASAATARPSEPTVVKTDSYFIINPNADVGENNTYNIDNNEIEILTYSDNTVTYGGYTIDELNASLPCEHIPAKLAAGIDVHVLSSVSSLDEQQMVIFNDGFKTCMESMGIIYEYSNANGSSVTQLEQCENYLLMKSAALIVIPAEGNLYGEIAAKAISQGTYFIIMGSRVDYPISGTKIIDQEVFGAAVGVAAVAYLDYAYPNGIAGSVKAAALYSTLNTDQVDYAKGVMSTLESDPRLDWAYRNDNCTSIDDGYNSAEEALTMNGDIRMFVCGTPSVAIGVNNYILSRADLNISEFACIMRGINPTTTELFNTTKAGGMAIFHVWGISGGVWMWQNDVQMLVDLLINEYEAPVIKSERIQVKTTFGYYYNSTGEPET